MVMSWMDKRKMQRVHPNVLSEYGLIIPDVAAIWLYTTNSDICYLENLFSNPEATNKHISICFLIDTASKAAAQMGYKFVMCVTDHKSILEQAIRLGAKTEPNKVLITLQLK